MTTCLTVSPNFLQSAVTIDDYDEDDDDDYSAAADDDDDCSDHYHYCYGYCDNYDSCSYCSFHPHYRIILITITIAITTIVIMIIIAITTIFHINIFLATAAVVAKMIFLVSVQLHSATGGSVGVWALSGS